MVSIYQQLCKAQPLSFNHNDLLNQWDLAEKASQVRLMRGIPSRCNRCIPWMGEVPQDLFEGDAKNVIDFIRYMAAVADEDGVEDEEKVPVSSLILSETTFTGSMKAL
ncbi:hypothetical protein FZEAL_8800 [Fusarium zealandicum]|uniref:Uncharacterized protein n=1 Tax=Fusarium zealandicum TaxID=1053134 RepID=A0A8H4UD68_9HYPO|nr:hypothetical protein FZEAL_8800 [Fusarium zealandicum]